jgi:stage II sporulation protein D
LPMGSPELIRRLSLLVAVLAALALASGAAASTLFVVKGKGWGHGVGMSQWGAQGKALRGVGYQDILSFYYQGTTLGAPGKSRVRVLLTSGRSSVRLSSAMNFKVGTRTLSGNTAYTVKPAADGKVRIVGVGKFANPVTASPGAAFLAVDGLRYRGNFRLWIKGGRVAVVNFVSLQGYLYSVVPREMPASFAPEALKAQAVAARSYAVRAHRQDWFDLYDDTSDQVYGGLDKPLFGMGEDDRTTAAVQATAGQVLRYGSQVAQAFFSSSNGGVEAASVHIWGGDPGYLNARADPDDNTPGNPNRSWRVLFTPSQLGNKLGTRRPADAVVASRASGRVRSMTLRGSGWSETVSDGTSLQSPEYFRSALGLRSARFWVGVQALNTDARRSRCKLPVHLAVFAHDVGNITVEQRRATSSTWTAMTLTQVDATHWKATRRPCVSMNYRLRSRDAVGPRIHVDVSPNIAFDARQRPGALKGKVNPLLPGTPVTIQRRTSAGWRNVATTTIRSDGTFRAAFTVRNGVYRAKVVPPASTGLVTGFSPTLTVVTG